MQNKGYKRYRSETVRLRSWDYGCNGVYFVTICTNNRKCYFGEVKEFNTDGYNVETQNLASLHPDKQKPFNTISEYIRKNPEKWVADKYYVQ